MLFEEQFKSTHRTEALFSWGKCKNTRCVVDTYRRSAVVGINTSIHCVPRPLCCSWLYLSHGLRKELTFRTRLQ